MGSVLKIPLRNSFPQIWPSEQTFWFDGKTYHKICQHLLENSGFHLGLLFGVKDCSSLHLHFTFGFAVYKFLCNCRFFYFVLLFHFLVCILYWRYELLQHTKTAYYFILLNSTVFFCLLPFFIFSPKSSQCFLYFTFCFSTESPFSLRANHPFHSTFEETLVMFRAWKTKTT